LRSLNQKCQLTNSPTFSRQQNSCVIGAYRARAELYRSKLTGDALSESRSTPEQLSQIQQALIALGFLNGEPDGEFGPMTRAAIRKYQEANGFPQRDYLSDKQRRALLERRAERSPGTSSTTRDAPSGKRAEGEFARLVGVPPACLHASSGNQAAGNHNFSFSRRYKLAGHHLKPRAPPVWRRRPVFRR
jgi:hypothetical protein